MSDKIKLTVRMVTFLPKCQLMHCSKFEAEAIGKGGGGDDEVIVRIEERALDGVTLSISISEDEMLSKSLYPSRLAVER